MAHTPAWRATDEVARSQLTMFHTLSEQARLTADDRRRALDLDEHVWAAWVDFLSDGPLPAEPPIPEMLLRLGSTAFALSMAAEQRAA